MTQILRPDSQTIAIGYDAAGRPNGLTLPNGNVSMKYKSTTGQLDTLTSATGGALAFAYNGALPTSATWSGAVAGSVGYSYGRLPHKVDGSKLDVGVTLGRQKVSGVPNRFAIGANRAIGTCSSARTGRGPGGPSKRRFVILNWPLCAVVVERITIATLVHLELRLIHQTEVGVSLTDCLSFAFPLC